MNGKVKLHCVLMASKTIIMCRRECELRRALKTMRSITPADRAVRFWKEIKSE